MKRIDKVEKYWATRRMGKNSPPNYKKGKRKSNYMVQVFEKHVPKGNSILELGCNIGRNLWYLQRAGYKRLVGIDINPYAIKLSKQIFPELKATMICDRIENVLPITKSADVILTMACLCHVHSDIEWIVFDEMMRVARRKIIIFEDEHRNSTRHCARKYQEYFKGKFDLIDSAEKVPGMYWKYKMRVFQKR